MDNNVSKFAIGDALFSFVFNTENIRRKEKVEGKQNIGSFFLVFFSCSPLNFKFFSSISIPKSLVIFWNI